MTTEARPPVEDVIKDMGDDALAETAKSMKEEGNRLLRMAGLAHHELEERMIGRNATKLDTDHWAGTMKPGSIQHDIDTERMMPLRSLLTDAEWAAAYVHRPAPEPTWNQRELNELAKRGGAIRAAIEAGRTSERGRPRLELKRKETDDDDGE